MKAAGVSRRHDRDVSLGWAWGGTRDDTQYGSEQILSSTLFRVYQLAGGDDESDVAERQWAARYLAAIIIKAIALLSRTARDPGGYVDALIQTDQTHGTFEGHPGGAFRKILRWSFEQQGLYQSSAAPRPITAPGTPPAVDVFIHNSTPMKDGVLQSRRGDYAPFLTDFRGVPEVWNRHAADGGTVDEATAPGVTNYLYVHIGNRGLDPATGISVRAFEQAIVSPEKWPTDWKALGTSVAGPSSLSAGASVVLGPIPWTPSAAVTEVLLAVEAAGDSSNLATIKAGPIANRRLVRLDNNLAQRRFRGPS
jgi:hypothetical protein